MRHTLYFSNILLSQFMSARQHTHTKLFSAGYKVLLAASLLLFSTTLATASSAIATKYLNGPGNSTIVQIEMTIGACDADTMTINLPKVTDNCDTNVDILWSRSDEAEELNAPLLYDTTTVVQFTATDNAGNQTGKELIINVKPQITCAINEPDSPPPSLSSGNTLSAVTEACIISYDWYVEGDGWEIVEGNGSPTILYTSGSTEGLFTLVVTDEYNCQSECAMSVIPTTNRNIYEASGYSDVTVTQEEVSTTGLLSVAAFPNPFKKATNIKFTVEYDTDVTVEVYSTVGRLLEVIYDNFVKTGETVTTVFKRKHYEKQVYLYKVTTDKETVIGKLIPE